MPTTIKPKIIRLLFSISDRTSDSVLSLLNIIWFCSVSVVFFGEFVENGKAFAQEEEPQKCIKLKDPTTIPELQEFRVCLKKLTRERDGEKSFKITKRSYEGSLKLMDNLNMKSDNKTSKKLPEES
ncbi:MAG: hypothetical protein OSB08_02585 [SAR324 cluster bacterium]|nr:hypothetical protein [SAR324 cluster bacterium]